GYTHPLPGRSATGERYQGHRGGNDVTQRDLSATHQKSRSERCPDEHSVASAPRSRSGTSATTSLRGANSELLRQYQPRQTAQSGENAPPWTSATKPSRLDHGPEK